MIRAAISISHSVLLSALGVLWLGAVGTGFALLVAYDNRAGVERAVPDRWPADSEIHRTEGRATLVLFAHPRCPCTRASLGELEEIVARCPGKLVPWVVFFKPALADDDWAQTDLWRSAAAIPGAHVLCDSGGCEAERFGATTSGHALLYSDQGELQFSGGITFARGHAGDNLGQSSIESCLAGEPPKTRTTPVFGCPVATVPTGAGD